MTPATPNPVTGIDPRGRVDVLTYRVIDRLAARVCQPAEWQLLSQSAWQLCQRLNPRPPKRKRQR